MNISGRLDNGPGADATCTDEQTGCLSAVCYGSDLLQIGQPTSFCLVMSVAHIIAGYRPFTTNFTFTRHDIFTPYNGLFVKITYYTDKRKKSNVFS